MLKIDCEYNFPGGGTTIESSPYLTEYLHQLAQARGGVGYEAFVLKYGRRFIATPRPKGVRKRTNKLCFQNAFALASRDPSYIYAEGWATNLAHFHHAWCVTRDGVVVDPTWEHPEVCEYFGVPFQLVYVAKTILAHNRSGTLPLRFNNVRPDEVDVTDIVEVLLP